MFGNFTILETSKNLIENSPNNNPPNPKIGAPLSAITPPLSDRYNMGCNNKMKYFKEEFMIIIVSPNWLPPFRTLANTN